MNVLFVCVVDDDSVNVVIIAVGGAGDDVGGVGCQCAYSGVGVSYGFIVFYAGVAVGHF